MDSLNDAEAEFDSDCEADVDSLSEADSELETDCDSETDALTCLLYTSDAADEL